MKNRVLLIRPPTVMKGTSFIATQFPLNIAGIAAALLNAGYDVRIWDFDVEHYDEKDFVKRLKDFKPFMAGISCYTPTIINGHRIAAVIKSHAPETVTVVGGPHVSALMEDTMSEFSSFDIGAIGEGEEVAIESAEKLSCGKDIDDAKGIIYRRDGALRFTGRRPPIKDLDALPVSARQLLNIPLYKGQSHRGFSRSFLKITEIMTSRGCPNRCIFCASDVIAGSGVRFRSADSVKMEIAECVERYGFNHFTLSADTFALRKDRLYDR